MSQDRRDDEAARDSVPAAESNDRREFLRQSLGVAPLMLTLGGRSHGGKTSMHGTLWSSLGTKWRHRGNGWGWKNRRWNWSKRSGSEYRGRDEYVRRNHDQDDWRVDDKAVPARRDWDWNRSEDHWRRDLEARTSRRDAQAPRQRYETTDRPLDWRDDDKWKHSEGLSPFVSDKSDRKKD